MKSSYIPNLRKGVKKPEPDNLIKLAASLKIDRVILFRKMDWLAEDDPESIRNRVIRIVEKLPKRVTGLFLDMIESYAEKFIDRGGKQYPRSVRLRLKVANQTMKTKKKKIRKR